MKRIQKHTEHCGILLLPLASPILWSKQWGPWGMLAAMGWSLRGKWESLCWIDAYWALMSILGLLPEQWVGLEQARLMSRVGSAGGRARLPLLHRSWVGGRLPLAGMWKAGLGGVRVWEISLGQSGCRLRTSWKCSTAFCTTKGTKAGMSIEYVWDVGKPAQRNFPISPWERWGHWPKATRRLREEQVAPPIITPFAPLLSPHTFLPP